MESRVGAITPASLTARCVLPVPGGATTSWCRAFEAHTASCSGSGRRSGNGHRDFDATRTSVLNPVPQSPERAGEIVRHAAALDDLFGQ